jgi:hypothetical protein
MSRVFLLCNSNKYDYSNAEKFGKFVFLLEGGISPFNINEQICKISSSLKANEFDCENDYICMTGNTLSLCWLSVAIFSLFNKVNLLLFDSKSGEYVERKLECEKK